MPRTGRPPIDNPRTDLVQCRVTPDEKAQIQAAADRAGMPVADWLRAKALNAAKRVR